MTSNATRNAPAKPSVRASARKPWRLSEYFPYHLSFTAELMSMQQSEVLFEATGLSMSEWRVMAVIGSFQPLSTKTVASFTTMNKVAVSRAVSRLVELGYVVRELDPTDSRLLCLEFSAEGKREFARITNLVGKWSQALLDEFTDDELALMKRMLARLRASLRETAHADRTLNDKQLFGEF